MGRGSFSASGPFAAGTGGLEPFRSAGVSLARTFETPPPEPSRIGAAGSPGQGAGAPVVCSRSAITGDQSFSS